MAGWASGLQTKEVQLTPMADTTVAATEPSDAAVPFNAAVPNTAAAVPNTAAAVPNTAAAVPNTAAAALLLNTTLLTIECSAVLS